MKKIIYLSLFLLTSFTSLNAQNYVLVLSTSTTVGVDVSGNFTVNPNFDNLIKSINGVSNVAYRLGNDGIKKIIIVSLLKDNISHTIGFEIISENDISAMVSNNTVTHECDGNSGNVLTYCQCCDFTYGSDNCITGCECCKAGACAHKKTTTEININNTGLADFIDTTFLQN